MNVIELLAHKKVTGTVVQSDRCSVYSSMTLDLALLTRSGPSAAGRR